MTDKACQKCKRIMDGKEKKCPVCGGDDFTRSFQGMVIIFNPAESRIAKKLNITAPGKYALKV